MASLADYLRLSAEHLPAELITIADRDRLLQVAKRLPPVHQLLLECPLGGTPGRIDVSLFCESAADVRRLLASLKHQSTPVAEKPDRRALLAHLEDWLSREDDGLWLELDHVTSLADGPDGLPAVFAKFHPNLTGADDGGSTREFLVKQLSRLAQRLALHRWSKIRPGLEQLLAIVPAHVVLGYIGLMWSRPVPTLRLNLGAIDRTEAADLLLAVGIDSGAAVERALALAYAEEYGVVLCLDIDEAVVSRIGFEVFPRDVDRPAGIWLPWQQRLLETGLCRPVQAQALENWPRVLTPLDTTLPWPWDLMVESLLRGTAEFSSLRLAVNHFKLVLESDGRLLAKAYLSVSHVWAALDSGSSSTALRR